MHWLHHLFIARLEAFGFQKDALNLVYDHLYDKKQNETFSCSKDVEYGVPLRSIFAPLFFDIQAYDVFHVLEDLDIASYAKTLQYIQLKKTTSMLLLH